MKLVLSQHARERMRERGLSERDVRLALLHPDQLEIDKTNPHRFLAKKIYRPRQSSNRRLIMVIYEVTNGGVEVITVISTSKIHKYL